MRRLLRILALALAVLFAGSASAGSTVPELIERLARGEDFRVRVQAALDLGKSRAPEAREPLERALDDGNAAVRASAAAALKVLGDRRALPALERHRDDESAPVRAAVKRAIAHLEAQQPSGAGKPRVLVKMGKVTTKEPKLGVELGAVESTSRERLGAIPGVGMLSDDADPKAESKKAKVPAVLVTGRLKRLTETKSGSEVEFAAAVEFMVHRLPEQSIAGTVSGSARTTASVAETRDKARAAELRRTVLFAAVESALKRAPAALLAAAK
ncbi:MAG: HEAT repeat domain-containing protein [Polyangiaceae bacterium]|nr:HEAT repeat domain-containing protein [Polyangiaceae bacterium]